VPPGFAIHGRVAVITGAGRGIGAALAAAFAEAGASLVLVDIDGDGVASTAKEVGGLPLVVDVSTSRGAADVVAAVVDAYERVDILVNNAASYVVGPVAEMDNSAWEFTQRNVLGPVYFCCRAALPVMVAQGSGVIVNLASVNHRIGAPHHGAYAAAKGGVVSLTRQLAVEYGPSGIRVNSLSPGSVMTENTVAPIRTDAYPLRRFARTSEVAAAALFLASDAASFITGVDLPVDGGLTALSPAAVSSPGLRQRWGLPPIDAIDEE
jgi:NAD(P)-dependent dehydrogenase (short-subunit alcohol dehydrogenase family)